MLVVRDIDVSYGNIRALKGVSLEVQEKEIVCLLGANGAGKTTMMRAITKLVPVQRGAIEFMGQVLNDMSPAQIVRQGISCVPEGRKIFPEMTVLENLEMGAYPQGYTKAEMDQNLEKAFALFPILKERMHQAGGTLSGGQQQMLAIARALMAKPRLLLLDEPSLGLAPLLVERVFEAIQQINKQEGITVLLAEQNARMALRISQKGYVLVNGEITLSGTATMLQNNEEVKKNYLGG
ncbi:MAG: ABC transporter ATP-binding protein [Limnochordia bacterium]|nr:ABC transporter ATP-binding protein [Bacillota bacterium]